MFQSTDNGKVASKFLLAPLTVFRNDPSSIYLMSNTARAEKLFNLSTNYDFSKLEMRDKNEKYKHSKLTRPELFEM